ncbi:hypothetical protein KSP9073_01290 [Kushneria phyllosphaerae]|uniref:EF-hand domain-containing protein n=1 Tax=Kushneria phyllosphaerae TaxID=2100822 RepID=A0A2R8CK88_9GAMM|nr:hypothetical protein KSP9073_01290 [Kushneria phyllosphaerae]
MRSGPTRYRDRLSGLVIVATLAGCAQHSTQHSDAAQAGTSSDDGLNVDALFDQANTDARSGLSALDLERLGLGDHWNTLDKNGDGQISRQEFRRRLDDPAISQRLHALAQGSEGKTSEQAVSSAWHLPPESPSQTWQRSNTSSTPATLSAPSSAPSAAAWGVSGASEEQAPVEPAAPADNSGDSASP